MATPQPQPQPQQPIYAAELNTILERHFVRISSYIDDRFRGNDARMDGILAQMRLDRQESQARDDALLKRIENVEMTQQTIIEIQRETIAAVQELRQAVQETRHELREMRQEMRNGFTALDEKINELSTRVIKLEGGLPPASTEN